MPSPCCSAAPPAVRLTQAHVIEDRSFYQFAVLEYKGNCVHKFLFADVLNVNAADEHFTLLRVEKSRDDARKGRFTAARWADKSRRLTCGNFERNIGKRIFRAIVAERYPVQLNGVVRRMARLGRISQRLHIEHAVDTVYSVLYHHFILIHVHYFGKYDCDYRCDYDVEKHIEQKIARDIAVREPKCANDEERKNAVYRESVECHRDAHIERVVSRPLFVVVDRTLEFFEGENRLAERLDNGDPANVLDRFIRHFSKGVLVLGHAFLQAGAGHRAHHDDEADQNGHKTKESEPPVENEIHRQQADYARDCFRFVGQLVREVTLRRARGLADSAAQFTAAEFLYLAERQRGDMLSQRDSDIRSDAKRRKMRTHQSANVHKNRQHREKHREPAVMSDVFCLIEVGRYADNFI